MKWLNSGNVLKPRTETAPLIFITVTMMMMFANICEMAQFRQRLNAKHGGSRSDKRLNAETLVKLTKPEDGELIKSA